MIPACLLFRAMCNAQSSVIVTILTVRACEVLSKHIWNKPRRGIVNRKYWTDFGLVKEEYGLVISTSITEVDFEPTSFMIIYLMILLSNNCYWNYLHRKYRFAFGVLDVDQGVAYGVYQDTIQTNGYNIYGLNNDINCNTRWRGYTRLIPSESDEKKKYSYSFSISHL